MTNQVAGSKQYVCYSAAYVDMHEADRLEKKMWSSAYSQYGALSILPKLTVLRLSSSFFVINL